MTLCPTCGRLGSQRGDYCPSMGRGGFVECRDAFHDRTDHAGVLTDGRPPGTYVYVRPCEAKSLISALETALGEVSK